MTLNRHLGWTAFALLTLAGCDVGVSTPQTSEPNRATTPPAASPDAPKNDVKALPVEPTKGADATKLSDDEIAEIKKLPAEDQPIALAQVSCPVSGEKLGEMGTPIKQEIKGKSFFICCASCKEKVQKDPDAVLAKLNK